MTHNFKGGPGLQNYVAILLGSIIAVFAVAIFNFRELLDPNSNARDMDDLMDLLQGDHVHMRDPERVKAIIEQFINDGKDKFQVLSDFDRTLSSYVRNGRQIPTCHGAMDDSNYLPKWYRTKANGLRNKYYPMEMDSSLPLAQKRELMVEWWTTAHDLLVQCDLYEKDIENIVRDAHIELREGATEMFQTLHSKDVPVLIFSAGIGNILKEAIKQSSKFLSNTHVISNFMEFDSQGKLTGFVGELIHTFNKHEVAVHHPEIFEKYKDRTNVMLLGDTLGDLTMVDGMEYRENVLTIGFLNDHIKENLEPYKQRYDIVLQRDETMDIARAIIEKIV